VSAEAWEFVFMMLVLKLPILYLIGVVWWAVRAVPDPYEPAVVPSAVEPDERTPPSAPCTWRAGLRPRPPRRSHRRVSTVGARR
jgi:hypothetical protein